MTEFNEFVWDPTLHKWQEQLVATLSNIMADQLGYQPKEDGYWHHHVASVSEALDQLAEDGYAGAGAGASSGGDYSLFFALMPGDNSATVAAGASVQFPADGPSKGSIVRTGSSNFKLPAVGDYEVSFQVSVAEAGQLQLALGGVGLPNTVVGRATGTSQLYCSTFITTTVADSILSVINPVGNSTALTITPVAGGTHSVSATLTIKAL